MTPIKFVSAFAIAVSLAACGHKPPASVDGIKAVFKAPPHEIRGKTDADQAWIDETVAVGQSCCDWSVPPRPAALDAVPPAPPLPPTKPKPKKKKKPLWTRMMKGS